MMWCDRIFPQALPVLHAKGFPCEYTPWGPRPSDQLSLEIFISKDKELIFVISFPFPSSFLMLCSEHKEGASTVVSSCSMKKNPVLKNTH